MSAVFVVVCVCIREWRVLAFFRFCVLGFPLMYLKFFKKIDRGIIDLRQKIDMEIHRTTLHSFRSPTAPSRYPADHPTSRTLRRVVHSVGMLPTIAFTHVSSRKTIGRPEVISSQIARKYRCLLATMSGFSIIISRLPFVSLY